MAGGTYRISRTLAQTIVEAARDVVGYDINFIGPDGIVLASTMPERIGTFHAAALRAYDRAEPLEVGDGDSFPGARRGINYPVLVGGARVGVIGVTGEPEACRPVGALLVKMTEMLIQEQRRTVDAPSQDEFRGALARLLIFGESPDGFALRDALWQAGLDPAGQAVVALLGPGAPGEGGGAALQPPKPLLARTLSAAPGALYVYVFPNQYAVIAPAAAYGAIKEAIVRQAEAEPGAAFAGLGGVRAWEELELSYREARLALRHAENGALPLGEYAEPGLALLLGQLDARLRRDYAHKRVGSLTSEERETLRAYYAGNLSLKATAAALYLHKNTLQYRLDKIAEKTGLDPRAYASSVELYIALLLEEGEGRV